MPLLTGPATDPVTLAEFKTHLNLSASTAESDVELGLHLDAAVQAVEKRVGPIITRTYLERVTARGGRLVVHHLPLEVVQSLVDIGGTAWDVADLYVAASGVVSLADGRPLPDTVYDVTYDAGRGSVASERHKLAVLYVAEHLWQMQRRGPSARPGLHGEPAAAGEASADYVYRGFALPARALELLFGDEDDGFA